MVNLLYLAVPIALILAAAVALSLRDARLGSTEAGVDDFSRRLRALAPGSSPRPGTTGGKGRRRWPRGGTRPG